MRDLNMAVYVKNIFSTAAFFDRYKDNEERESTDVIVTLSNDEKYLATFFTFDYVNKSKVNFKESGEYLNGKCFYYNNMVLIDELSLPSIKEVVIHLFEEGVLSENFKKIGPVKN